MALNGTIAGGSPGLRAQAHRLAGREGRGAPDARSRRSMPTWSPSASTRARTCPPRAGRRAGRRRRQGRLQEALDAASRRAPAACWWSGSASARRSTPSAPASRRRWRRRRPAGSRRPRSPGLLPESDDDAATAEGLVTGTILGSYRFDRFLSADPDGPSPASDRVADAARPRRGRRCRRGGARSAPRPRTAPATCRACPRTSPPPPSSPPAPRRSPPRTTRSASRCSAASRSPPRRWAAWSRSARAAPRSRS